MPRTWGARAHRKAARRFAQLDRRSPPPAPPSRRRPRALPAMTPQDWRAVDMPSATRQEEP
jgi:hypothetical protein